MRWISRPGWPGHLLALAAGALTPLALAPFDYWPLAILSIALLYLGLRGLPGKSALWRGWWYGFGAFGAGTSWIYVSIHDYGAASVPLASFLMLGFTAGVAFFFALPAWLWARCLRRDNAPLGDALAFAALWLALELFRSWFLTGFPWLYAGYSQLQGPLAGLVPVGGVWLSSFVIALSAALLVNLPRLFPHGASLLLGLVLLLGPWAAGLYLKGHAWTHSAGEPLRVVAIQGNIAQELKWDPNQVRAHGPADQPLLKAKGYEIAPYICYEVVYPEFAAALAAQSQVLLTVSNDTWFGTSIGPLQHLQMAQMRALESGRWMIRATNNGVTGLIDPYGRIVRQIPQFQQGILRGEVIPMQGLTPYLQYRVWPLAGLAGVLLLWALLGRQLRPQERRLFG